MDDSARSLRGRIKRRLGLVVSVAALAASCAACDNVLEVDDPDIILPGDLEAPEGLAALRAGAVGDFAFAYSAGGGNAGNDTQIMVTGLFADEWILSGTFTSRLEIDRRAVDPANGAVATLFENISRARRAAEEAARRLTDASGGGSDRRTGEMWALAGYTYLFLGEAFCNGVPVSRVEDGAIVPGEPRTDAELFRIAVERFDRSLDASDGDGDLIRLATVGKARALVNLDRVREAADLVGDVETGWRFLIRHSANTDREENAVHALNTGLERWSVADQEGGGGLAFRQLDDPRVPWSRTPPENVGWDGSTPQFNLLKYPGPDAPVVLAGGDEARYVEAEAALRSGDLGAFLEGINRVRSVLGLAPLTDPGAETARQDLLFRERALTLYARGTRLGDLRRLIRQYGRRAEDVLPTGDYFKGGEYGTDVNLPVPAQERNNPNFSGCLDRSA